MKLKILSHNETQLREFVQQLPDTCRHMRDGNGQSLVHNSARMGDAGLPILRLLVEKWGRQCLKDKRDDGDTPVHLIFAEHSKKSLQFVKDTLGREFWQMRGGNGETVAHRSVTFDKQQTFEWLLENADAGFLTVTDDDGNMPVHLYAENAPNAALMPLIKEKLGSQYSQMTGSDGRTVAHFAAENQRSDAILQWIVHDLEASGLVTQSLTHKDVTDITPLHLAAQFQSVHSMEIMKEKLGFQFAHLKSVTNETPLHFAARNCKDDSVFRWMVESLENAENALLLMQNSQNETPVHLCAQFQTEDTMEFVWNRLGDKCLTVKGQWNMQAVHYAAMDPRMHSYFIQADNSTLKWIVSKAGVSCLKVKDDLNRTAVHLCAEFQDEDSLEFIRQKLGPEYLQMKGQFNRTAAHIAACNEIVEFLCFYSALKWIVQNEDEKCLTVKDDFGNTPVHYAAQRLDDSDMQFISGKLNSDVLKMKNQNGRLPVHEAALHGNDKSLSWFIENADSVTLTEKDSRNFTPLHFTAQFCSSHAFHMMCEKLGIKVGEQVVSGASNETKMSESDKSDAVRLLSDKTNDGSCCLHLLCYNRRLRFRVFQSVLQTLEMSVTDAVKLMDERNRSPLFYACLGKNFEFLKEFLKEFESVISRDEFKDVQDADGNSLLHAMFQMLQDSRVSWDASHIAKAISFTSCLKHFASAGFDLTVENSNQQTCLQAADIEIEVLNKILLRIGGQFSPAQIQQMVTNSEGVHAVHIFCSRYNMNDQMLHALSRMCRVSDERLIQLKVTAGANKGATCLHFACEAGRKDSIRFLMKRGLKLSAETDAGESCVDFGIKKGKLEDILTVAKEKEVKFEDLLRLIDPAKRAVRLPDRKTARSLLDSFVDRKLRSTAEAESKMRNMRSDDREGQSKEAEPTMRITQNDDNKGESAEMQLLLRAVELDSSEMLRSLFVIGFWQDTHSTDKEPHKADLSRILNQERRNIGDENFDKKFPNLASRDGKIPESSVIDVSLSQEKTEILLDICVTSQFDLIPTCLTLLIRLDEKIRSQQEKFVGKHEQLSSLQSSVFCVLMNSLDSLFTNGDENQQMLLFRYLTADFNDGPRFSNPRLSDSSHDKQGDNEVSVLDLMETVDNKEVFATDCMSKFVDSLWSRPVQISFRKRMDNLKVRKEREPQKSDRENSEPQKSEPKSHELCDIFALSNKTKFAVHFLSFFTFLIFFAWFVTDFVRSLDNLAFLVLMFLYAASFTAQEVNELVNRRQSTFIFRKKTWKLPRYFTEVFNFFDIAALVLMWIGLIWMLMLQLSSSSPDTVHGCQMVLTASFLLWGIRSIEMMSFFKFFGPLVSMLKGLVLRNLLSFLVLLLVIFYSFGVFFFNLLHPAASSVTNSSVLSSESRDFWQILQEIWTFPLLLAFGLFETGDLQSCNRTGASVSWLDCVDDTGLTAFNVMLVFVFLLLVNMVMWNLLIALFSQTVVEKQSRAVISWRKRRYEMLKEVQLMSILPAPLSVLEYLCKFIIFILKRLLNLVCCRKKSPQVSFALKFTVLLS
ncbi:MAG: hypothetical protein V2I33_17865 [Kangiellaceae bacterium]|nr:hypothetical protein [Kangiellaceae bacterium]